MSDTPETDALFPPSDDSLYSAQRALAQKLERERNAARVPICIGKPIIGILASEGAWTSENGRSLVAADCLYGSNPYEEIAEAKTQMANITEDVIRSCGQFIPPDAMSAVASLERLCDLTGVSRQLLKRYIRP